MSRIMYLQLGDVLRGQVLRLMSVLALKAVYERSRIANFIRSNDVLALLPTGLVISINSWATKFRLRPVTLFSTLTSRAPSFEHVVSTFCHSLTHSLTKPLLLNLYCKQTNTSLWRVRRNKDILYHSIFTHSLTHSLSNEQD